MSPAEYIRRAARRAEEAARAVIDKFITEVKVQVERLVERLTGDFIGADNPRFQEFERDLIERQEAVLSSLSETVDVVAEEEIAQVERELTLNDVTSDPEELAWAIQTLKNEGLDDNTAEYLVNVMRYGTDYDDEDGRWRRFFGWSDLQAAIRAGLPLTAIVEIVVVGDLMDVDYVAVEIGPT